MRAVTSDEPARRATTWQDVADDIRRRLAAGEFATGERLPSRRALMETYGAADRTVARALHRLQEEGFVVGRPRTGWVVREQRAVIRSTRNRLSRSERDAGRGAFTTDLHDVGLVPDVTTEVRLEEATDQVAGALDVAPGEAVCVRSRTMRARQPDAEPGTGAVLQLATSYLPRSITAGTEIESPQSGPGGIYARLEEAGHALTHFTERVQVGRATEDDARDMRIAVGDPVFRVWRTAWAGDRPVEINDITITGDRVDLTYELPAE